MSTETPRTDAVVRDIWDDSLIAGRTTPVVSAHFARTLERELAAAQATIAERDKEIERLRSVLAFYGNRKNWGAVASYSDNYWYMAHKAPWRLAQEASRALGEEG